MPRLFIPPIEQRAAVPDRIGQRGERRFKEIAARERALERTGDKADAPRGPRRAASKLRAAAERAQQHGAPELCIQRAAGAVFAPVDQVMKGTVVHCAPRPRGNTRPAAAAAVGLCGFLRAEQAHEQRGGLLAKGRLLGVQFSAILEEELYFTLSRQADEFAMKIRRAFEAKGCPMLYDSYTNQQYPIMPDDELAEIGKSFGYEYWERVDETHSGVRFCASWATTQENVDALRAAVQALKK